MWWLIMIVAGGGLLAVLEMAEVMGWFGEVKDTNSAFGELIKERLDNGDYRVVAGVFNKAGNLTDSNAWESEEIEMI